MDMKPLSIEKLEELGFQVQTTKRKGVVKFNSCVYEWDDIYLFFDKPPTFSQIIDSIVQGCKVEMYYDIKREVKRDFIENLSKLID